MDNVPALAKESGFLENETIVATEEEVRSEDDILNRMTYEEDISTCENETVVQSNVTEESSFAEGTNGSTEEKSNLTEEGSSLVEESSSIEESAILSEEDTVQDDSAINEENSSENASIEESSLTEANRETEENSQEENSSETEAIEKEETVTTEEQDSDGIYVESETKSVRGIIESVDNWTIKMTDGAVYWFASMNEISDPSIFDKANNSIGKLVECVLVDELIIDIKVVDLIDEDIPVQMGKFAIYAKSISSDYDYEKNQYGTIKNVTFIVDGDKYFTIDGILYLDCDETSHEIYAAAPGFVESPLYLMRFTDKEKGSIILYPVDKDEVVYVEGKIKNIDPWEGILLDNNKWYKEAKEVSWGGNTGSGVALPFIGKNVRLSIKYGVVFAVDEISQPKNPKPYGGKNIRNYTREEIVEIAAKEYNDALNGYFKALGTSAEAELKNQNKAPKNVGAQLYAIDEKKGSKRLLTLDAKMPTDAVYAAYEGLAEYLDTYVQKGVDLGKIDLSKSEVRIGAKLIKKIRNSMDSVSFSTRTSKGYYISIKGLGFSGAYWGQMTIRKGNKTYYGNLSSNIDDTAAVMEDYLNQLADMTKDLSKQALTSLISEFLNVTCISEFTKGELKSFFKNKVQILQKKGYGKDILKYVVQLYDDYELSKDLINAAKTNNFKDKLKDVKKVYNKLKDRDYSDSSVQSAIVNGAMNKLTIAKDHFKTALFDYIYNADTYKEKYLYTLTSSKKISVNCPVEFEIKDTEGKIIGSYLENKIYQQPAYVDISVYGDRKVIILKDDIAAEITLIPTDEGVMDYIIEQEMDGEVIGRLCFYDIALEEGSNYTQELAEDILDGSVSQYPLVAQDDSVINANEFLSAESDAIVTIACSVQGGGTVSGAGDYVKADAVTLIAIPDYGYTFAGWYKDDIYFGNDSTYKCIADNISLEARFEEKRLTHPDYMPKTGKEYEEIIGEHIYIGSDNGSLADIELRIDGVEDASVFQSITIKGYFEGESKYSKEVTPNKDEFGNLWINGFDLSGCDEIVFYDSGEKIITSLYYVKNYLELDLENITISEEYILSEDLICNNLQLVNGGNIVTNGYNLTIINDVTLKFGYGIDINRGSYCKIFGNMNGRVTIDDGKYIVSGDYSAASDYASAEKVMLNNSMSYFCVRGRVWSRDIEINDGTFCVNGNLSCESIKVKGEYAVLDVDGSFFVDGHSDISEGALYLAGDIEGVECSNANTTILDGNSSQRINGSFSNLKIEDSDRELQVEEISIGCLLSDMKFKIVSDYFQTTFGNCNFNGKKVNIVGDNSENPMIMRGGKLNLEGGELNIFGNVRIRNDIDLSGGNMNISGNADLGSLIYINKGKLNAIGNLCLTELENCQYNSGILLMQYPSDEVSVHGTFSVSNIYGGVYSSTTFTFDGIKYACNPLSEDEQAVVTAGTMKLYGNIEIGKFGDDGGLVFTGTHKTVICGNSTQEIKIESPIINEVEFKNERVVSGGALYLGRLMSDAVIGGRGAREANKRVIVLGACDLNGHNLTIKCDEDLGDKDYSDIYIAVRDYVDINNGELNIQGDFVVDSGYDYIGKIYLHGGKLNIIGLCEVGGQGSIKMDSSDDIIDIDGNFFAGWWDDNPFDISAGIIKVTKSIDLRLNKGVTLNAECVILDGYNDKVDYSVHSSGATIDTLKLTRRYKEYYFTDKCWNNLILLDEDKGGHNVTFDLKGHGTVLEEYLNYTGIEKGNKIKSPTSPKAKGYYFTGWFKDSECTRLWSFGTDLIAGDTTLYAGWELDNDFDYPTDEPSSPVERPSDEESAGEKPTDKETSDEESSNEESSEEKPDDEPSKDKDDSSSPATERQDLSTLNASIAGIRPQIYNRDEQEPAVKVTAFVNGKKTTLTEGMDYRVSYKNNIDAGTATITIKGNGAYKGSLTQNFTIRPKAVKKLKVVAGALSENATGSDLSSYPIHVYDGAKRLNLGTDYTLSSAGMTKNVAKVSITGKGNYTGTMTAKLSIYSVSNDHIINPDNVRLDKDTAAYTGKPVKTVNPIVTVSGSTLTLNQDYKVQYQNNTNAGTAYIIVTGKGAYRGRVVLPFEIQPVSASEGGVIIKLISAKTYNGKLQKPVVSVTASTGGKTKKLVKNKDYKVTYKNNLHAGTATVIITGKGNYAGIKAQTQFTIQPQNIAKAAVKGTQSSLQLTYNKRLLKQGVHYEAPSYGGSRKNKVQVTIKGKGDFTGQITKYIKQ